MTSRVPFDWQGDLKQLNCQPADVEAVDVNLAKLAAKGISVVISSGDSGSGYATDECEPKNIKHGVQLEGDLIEARNCTLDMCCSGAAAVPEIIRGWTFVPIEPPSSAFAAASASPAFATASASAVPPSPPFAFTHQPYHVSVTSDAADFPKSDVWVLDGRCACPPLDLPRSVPGT